MGYKSEWDDVHRPCANLAPRYTQHVKKRTNTLGVIRLTVIVRSDRVGVVHVEKLDHEQ